LNECYSKIDTNEKVDSEVYLVVKRDVVIDLVQLPRDHAVIYLLLRLPLSKGLTREIGRAVAGLAERLLPDGGPRTLESRRETL
jgi:hypothetical protein